MADTWTMKRGQYILKDVAITNQKTGAVEPLTGWTLKGAVRYGAIPAGTEVDDSLAFKALTVGSGLVASNLAGGVFQVELVHADTNTLEFPDGATSVQFRFAVEGTAGDGTGPYPLVDGTFSVFFDDTRAL